VGKLFKSALVAAAVALAAVTATVPASAAPAPKPANTAGTVEVGARSVLNIPWAWVHFKPTGISDHLTVNQGELLSAVCATTNEGVNWNLVYDHANNYVGWTFSSYLTNPVDGCIVTPYTAGRELWLHLAPHLDWETQIVPQGHRIAPICTLNANGNNWELIFDLDNGYLAGYTDYSAVGVPRPSCD
jgi:hypothetical protein